MNFLCLSCKQNFNLDHIPHACINSDLFKHKVRAPSGKSIDILLKLKCDYCGSSFTRSQYKIYQAKSAGTRKFFCSRGCTDKGRDKTKLFKGDNSDKEIREKLSRKVKESWSEGGSRFSSRAKNIEYICKNCKKRFDREPRKDTKYDFCSKKCAAGSRKKEDIEQRCIGCNKIFMIPPYKKNVRKYCTSVCFYTNTYDKRMERALNIGNTFYKRPVYKNIKFRSGWEAEVAQRLDDAGILWEYEKHRFNVETGKELIPPQRQHSPKHTVYIPDFYLPEFNIYLEVKGWWRKESAKKVLKFRSHGYKLTIIMEKDLFNKGKGVEDVGIVALSQ